MDSAERRELLKRLAGAVDADFSDDLAFFLEREFIREWERRDAEPQSPLYDIADTYERLGYTVLDVQYDGDGSIIVDALEPPP